MNGSCPSCKRVYDISDEFLAMGGKAKCPHCLLELSFAQASAAPSGGTPGHDRRRDATRADPRRELLRQTKPPPEATEVDGHCDSCGRRFKIDREYLRMGGSALCPHCGVKLVLQVPPLETATDDERDDLRVARPVEQEDEPRREYRLDEGFALGEETALADEPRGQVMGDFDQQLGADAEAAFAESSGEWAAEQAQEPEPEVGPTDAYSATSLIGLPELDALRSQAGRFEGGESLGLEASVVFDDEVGDSPGAVADENELARVFDEAEAGRDAVSDATVAEDPYGLDSIDEDDLPEDLEIAGPTAPRLARPDISPESVPAGERQATTADVPDGVAAGGAEPPDLSIGDGDAEATRDVDDGWRPEDDELAAAADEQVAPPESEVSTEEETFTSDLDDELARLEQEAADELDEPAPADSGLRTEATSDSEASAGEEEAPWDEESAQEGAGEEQSDGTPGSQPAQADAAQAGGLFSQLASDGDWASAAARWAQSGFKADEMPDFIRQEPSARSAPASKPTGEAPWSSDSLPSVSVEEGPPERTSPFGPEARRRAPVEDVSPDTLEVSDTDIIMMDEAELLPAGSPDPAALVEAPAESWAKRAADELRKGREARQVAAQGKARQAPALLGGLLSRLSSPVVLAAVLGVSAVVIVSLLWLFLGAGEDVEGVAFPTAGLKAQPVAGAAAPASYEPQGEARRHYGLGNRFAFHGKFDKAIGEYQRASRIDPGYPLPHRAMGAVYAALNQPTMSLAAYETYLRLAPKSPDATTVRKLVAEAKAKTPKKP